MSKETKWKCKECGNINYTANMFCPKCGAVKPFFAEKFTD
jgi:uncharacterized OB-fold protein